MNYNLINNIAEQYGTPFQLYDEKIIKNNIQILINSFKFRFQNFKQFFAVKATPNLNILKIVLEEGCGLDCSSYAELKYAEILKVPGELIMYTSNYTEKKDLKLALELNANINLDDISILDDLYDVNEKKMPEKICFRLNPGLGNTSSETESNILGGENSKFGISKEDIIDGYIKARELGAIRFGLHMMTGSCVLDYDYWNKTIDVMFEVINKLNENNIILEYINIGGGIGVNYKPDQEEIDMEKLVEVIYSAYNRNINKYDIKYKPNLYMENGRFITGRSGYLVARCHVIKKTNNKVFYGLDACMANLMRPGMYNSYHKISIPKYDNIDKEIIKANVVGTLCENNDWFAKDRNLPKAEKYDLFVIHDTGAHGHSMGFNYNSKLRCQELLFTTDDKIKLIRKNETVEDLIRLIC